MITEDEIREEIFNGTWSYEKVLDVELHIKHKQYSQDLEPDGEGFVRTEELEEDMEVMTDAKFYISDDTRYYIYDESVSTELKDCTTVLTLKEDAVSMKRYAKDIIGALDMEFIEGKKHVTRYHTPMGGINLELLTNKVDFEINDTGIGKILLDYNIKLEGLMSRRNDLVIEAFESKGEQKK
ncbi:MAG TPA: DUF1934 domain-containing protein [Anaerovoracaceae bacterium]|nr:DUF1934 domain-containing protein [Anaerovoracaceae bacterium]